PTEGEQNNLLLCFVPPKAMQSGILFLVSIDRGTSRRIYHCRTWLSPTSHLLDSYLVTCAHDARMLRGAPSRFRARPICGTRRCLRARTDARNPDGMVNGEFASKGA